MWIQDGTVAINRYWSIEHFETQRISLQDAEYRLESLLQDAVKLQLRSDVPLGLMLSGGVDSSALTAIAAKNIERPLNTFTINFSNKGGADSSFARLVAQQYKTTHQEINLSPTDLLAGLDEVIQVMDEPIADSAIVPTYAIAKFARMHGMKVMLSGAGGDEIFGGYRRHFPSRLGSPLWWAERLPSALRHSMSAIWAHVQPYRGFRVADPGVAYLAGVFGADLGFYQDVLNGKLFGRLMMLMQKATAPLGSSTGAYSYRHMFFDLNHYLLDNILALTDKATMGASVEGRVPLLDHRFVELAFSLPSSINLFGGHPKGLFIKVMSAYLPECLLERKKEGFNAPISTWMEGPLFSLIKEELHQRLSPILQDIVQGDKVSAYMHTQPSQPYLASTLFSLYVLNRWIRYHGV